MKKIALVVFFIFISCFFIACGTVTTDQGSTTPTNVSTAVITEATTDVTTSPETEAPVHTHSFSDATCSAPATCACGVTDGTALEHDYSTATCTAPKTCKSCGATDGVLGTHSYEYGRCIHCKEISADYMPFNSSKNGFSIVVPKNTADLAEIKTNHPMYADSDVIVFLAPYVEFEMIITRAYEFRIVKNTDAPAFEADWYKPFGYGYGGIATNEGLGFKLEQVCKNDEYTLYCQYIFNLDNAFGSDEDKTKLKTLMDLKEQLFASAKFN